MYSICGILSLILTDRGCFHADFKMHTDIQSASFGGTLENKFKPWFFKKIYIVIYNIILICGIHKQGLIFKQYYTCIHNYI